MPMRNLHVTGMPYSPAAATAERTIARNKLRFTGTAAPPPRRVTLGAGQPKFMSMWSTRPSRPSLWIAAASIAGSLP